MGDRVPPAAGNGAMLVKPTSWEALRKRVEQLEIIPDPLDFDVSARGGKKFFRLRELPARNRSGVPGGARGPVGPFAPYLTTTGEGAPAIAISLGSLTINIEDGTEQEVTGLNTAIELKKDTIVYMDIAYDSENWPDVTSAQITSVSGDGETPPDWPLGVQFSGSGIQTNATAVLGAVYAGSLPQGYDGIEFTLTEDGSPVQYCFRRELFTNLYTALKTLSSKAAMFPFAFSG